MKKWMYFVRYTNLSSCRRFLIQRNDAKFWSGAGWVDKPTKALVYRYSQQAQRDCRAFTRRHVRGLPRRRFRCSFVATVMGDGIDRVTPRDLSEYLLRVLHIGLDYEVLDDGPLSDKHVDVHVNFADLAEQ